MGATTKSITGLFANACDRNVCGRNVREQNAAGHGTRSATQGYLLLSLSRLRHASWRDWFACLVEFRWLEQARNEARWLLKPLVGQLMSALPISSGPNMSGMLPNTWGALSPVRCPASSKPQAIGRGPKAPSRRP